MRTVAETDLRCEAKRRREGVGRGVPNDAVHVPMLAEPERTYPMSPISQVKVTA
jgi:hypothetical protein